MSNRLKIHVVGESDCISSIAEANGFLWKTLWDNPENAALRELRKDPNVLLAGDEVAIPDLRRGSFDAPTEARHRFRLKGVPAIIRFRFMHDGEPRKNLECTVEIDGDSQRLTTDADGRLEIPIPPGAKEGMITVHTETGAERYPLSLGTLDPATEASGACQRLANLGFDCNADNPQSMAAALRRFQLARELEVSGKLDDQTREALVKAHGC